MKWFFLLFGNPRWRGYRKAKGGRWVCHKTFGEWVSWNDEPWDTKWFEEYLYEYEDYT